MFRYSLEDSLNRFVTPNESTRVNTLPNIYYKQQADKQAYIRQEIAQQVANKVSQNSAKLYNVQKGDNLWNIARANGISLDELKSLNPQLKSDIIHAGDTLKLTPEYETKLVNLRNEQAQEDIWNRNNITAIQHAQHDGNYVIVDKKNNNLSIFDKNNKLLYTTKDISTGLSGQDYNTVTYQGKGGLENYAGNNSTPAGILTISGTGTYHGAPSFQRSRFNPETGKPYQVHPWVKQDDGSYKEDKTKWVNDDVASSFHIGNTTKNKASNGCVRIGKQSLEDMSKYLGVGNKVYTLPENEGSRFVLKGGKLNFVADNPYGNTQKGKLSDKGKDMVNWDDYNTHIDKSYSPLLIKPNKKTNNQEHDINALHFANTISTNKQRLQKQFNLTSNEYNRLAQLAMGIAEQESNFGTGTSWNLRHNYKLKTSLSGLVSFIKGDAAQSRGYSQIKLNGDNKQLQQIYKNLGINEQSILTSQGSAIATIARLAYIYNTEVKGRNFKGQNNKNIDAYDALLYKWNGRNNQLTNHLATPRDNNYIRNVKSYLNNFDYYEERKYRK